MKKFIMLNPALVICSFDTSCILIVPLFVLCLPLLVLLYDKDASLGCSSTPGDQRRVKLL